MRIVTEDCSDHRRRYVFLAPHHTHHAVSFGLIQVSIHDILLTLTHSLQTEHVAQLAWFSTEPLSPHQICKRDSLVYYVLNGQVVELHALELRIWFPEWQARRTSCHIWRGGRMFLLRFWNQAQQGVQGPISTHRRHNRRPKTQTYFSAQAE